MFGVPIESICQRPLFAALAKSLMRMKSLTPKVGKLPPTLPSVAEAQYSNNFGKNKVRYGKFDWTVYHAPHFDVWYYSEEEHLLEKVLSLAESAYDSLSQDLDYQIQQPTPLIID